MTAKKLETQLKHTRYAQFNYRNIRERKKIPPTVANYRGNFCQKKFTGKEKDAETGLYYYGARYLDPKTSRWLGVDPAMGEYVPVAPVNDEARKRNGNLPNGGMFNYVNFHTYHYSNNNPIKYTDPDGETPRSALKLIAKHSDQIKLTAKLFNVDPKGIASIIFQEKYHGVFAGIKNSIALVIDGGVNDNTPSDRSYGLAEMQLKLVAELLHEDINISGTQGKMYEHLKDDNMSIALIGAYISKNEKELGIKLKGFAAGGAHNMGATGFKNYLKGERDLSSVAKRSVDYQQAINDALNGVIDVRKDSER